MFNFSIFRQSPVKIYYQRNLRLKVVCIKVLQLPDFTVKVYKETLPGDVKPKVDFATMIMS